MPQVPYQPVPQVGPSGEGIQGVRVSPQPEAFGVGIAQSLGHLGKVAEGAGDEIFRRAIQFQELQNQTEARQAQVQYELESTDLRADFHSKQGTAAGPAALTQYKENLTALRNKILGGMSNPDSRRRFDSESSGFLAREVFAGAGHSGQQVKVAANASIDAALATNMKTMASDPEDEGRYENWKAQTRELLARKAELHGLDPSVVDDWMVPYVSQGLQHRITELAKRDPEKAMKLFEANRDSIKDANILDKTEDVVRLQNRTQAAKLYAYGVALKGDPETWKSLEALKEDARAAAAKQDPNDKLLPAFYEHEVENKYWVHKREVTDQEQKTKLVLTGGLIGRASPDGKLPTTREELAALSPQIEDAMLHGNEATQKYIQDALARNARTGYAPTPETDARMHELRGMADMRPAEFLKVNLAAEKLPRADIVALYKIAEKVQVKAEKDPRVEHAVRVLSGDMLAPDVGITKQDPVRYERWKGALQIEMAEWQARNAKEMPDEEIRELGARLLQKVKDPEAWGQFLPGTRMSRMFELEIPSDIKKAMEERHLREKGYPATDMQIYQAWIARRHRELYGASE